MTSDEDLAPDRFPRHAASPRGFRQSYVRLRPAEGAGEGAGRPLVLLHGWPQTSRIWWRVLEPLAAAGFEVVAPDLRGFGESDGLPDAAGDAASHAADLHALLRDALGFERVVVVAGGLGGGVARALSLRFPGFVERLVLFNAPLPVLPDAMQGLRARPPAEALDGLPPGGADADALAEQLDTSERRLGFVASFYTSRFWAHPGGFSREAVAFLCEPFADAVRLRAGLAAWGDVLDPVRHMNLSNAGPDPTPALLLFGTADHGVPPDWDAMAAAVFPNRVGPFRVSDAGHFLQWEAAALLCGAVRHLVRPDPPPAPDEETAYVALGSNLGPRERHLAAAFTALRATRGVHDVVASRIYETDPVGPGEQGPYLNAVARLRTRLSPRALLERLLAVEREQGRSRGGQRNAPRTLDLDLLLHGERRLEEPDLVVPHPRLTERPFVLEPLCDVASGLVPPGSDRPVAELAAAARDPAAVRRRGE